MVHTLWNKGTFSLLRFYGKNSSYVHGGLDSNGKPAEAVYGQSVSRLQLLKMLFPQRDAALHSHTAALKRKWFTGRPLNVSINCIVHFTVSRRSIRG